MAGRRVAESAHRKRDAFLAAFAELGTITHAAMRAGTGRTSHRYWMEHDPEYPTLFAEAAHQANDNLEREARRRAVDGVDKPVYQGKELVGSIREYSDTLLIFLMKGALPAKYRERVEITMDVSAEAKRLAAELGLDEAEVLAEVNAILGTKR
jgi:hypothetical protein